MFLYDTISQVLLFYRPPEQLFLALIYYIYLKTVKSDFCRRHYIMQVTW